MLHGRQIDIRNIIKDKQLQMNTNQLANNVTKSIIYFQNGACLGQDTTISTWWL